MTYDEKKSLSNVRLEHAKECLDTAKLTYKTKDYKASANISY